MSRNLDLVQHSLKKEQPQNRAFAGSGAVQISFNLVAKSPQRGSAQLVEVKGIEPSTSTLRT